MTENTSRLTILVDLQTKKKLATHAETLDLTVSQILRKLVKDHLRDFGTPNTLASDKPRRTGEGGTLRVER